MLGSEFLSECRRRAFLAGFDSVVRIEHFPFGVSEASALSAVFAPGKAAVFNLVRFIVKGKML
jgi:hypothetical protein